MYVSVCVTCERNVTSTSTAMLTEAHQNCQLTHFADEWCDLERGPSEGGVVINDPPPTSLLTNGSEPVCWLSRLLTKSAKSVARA